MKKKRIIFPDKIKPWIDARIKYKLSHAQIEMARELGIDPVKFPGIVGHLQEHSKQPLTVFIEESYKERFGKNEPDDRRSIEQKLKAEAQQKDQKRSLKAQGKAAAKWEALPEKEKAIILGSVWCSTCDKMTTITDIEFQTMDGGIILNGKCGTCGGLVGRYVEGE